MKRKQRPTFEQYVLKKYGKYPSQLNQSELCLAKALFGATPSTEKKACTLLTRL